MAEMEGMMDLENVIIIGGIILVVVAILLLSAFLYHHNTKPIADLADTYESKKEEKNYRNKKRAEKRIKNNWDKITIFWLSLIFLIYGATMVASIILQILN